MTKSASTALGSWDPTLPNQVVRLIDKPGRIGITTGKSKAAGSKTLVQIEFGPNEKPFKSQELLELVRPDEDLFDILTSGKFGDSSDLRRVLSFEKIKGGLTNIFYSMETSNTEFYPHQFKAVLRFIESSTGRLLIADEVGLGKTIESIYIWKELQAREDARCLLIVCPAILREKWQRDLQERFNISAEIVDIKQLADKLENRTNTQAFKYIVSFESMRPPRNYGDLSDTRMRSVLARLLDENKAINGSAFFDLVIIDEAHYLRNPETANNRLGRLLRETSNHLLLLTATPVQISNDNLYQILRLIDPDEFYDSQLFQERITANAPIVDAIRGLRNQPADLSAVMSSINCARESSYFKDDDVLKSIQEELGNPTISPKRRIELSKLLENRSLISQYMVRSRKREVLEKKVQREPQVLTVNFSEFEYETYNRVTNNLWGNREEESRAHQFAIIMRQRQMASSLFAALDAWRNNEVFDELFWEDLGLFQIPEPNNTANENSIGESLEASDLQKLESADTKYRKLKSFLSDQLGGKKSEKFVIFAYFRGTLEYLQRRLNEDGISTALILGGMGNKSFEHIEEFRQKKGPNVLLSSEIGSEGIDLQCCRFIVNYDLPWNPMRVEQRIGRLDRLGQKADKISIINFVVEETIEDKILMRLYDRIKIFRESIGDLEHILGNPTYQLMEKLLDPKLDEAKRVKIAKEAEDAIIDKRIEQQCIEDQAVNLLGFSDYIYEQIESSRGLGRWIGADELISWVNDFFVRKYPGTIVELDRNKESVANILLSRDARLNLSLFILDSKPATRTMLHKSSNPILCYFDPRQTSRFGRHEEVIEPTHPLIQWIRKEYESHRQPLHPVSAISINSKDTQFDQDDYVYVIQRWSFDGIRKENQLSFKVMRIESNEMLNEQRSEEFVVSASKHGETLHNAVNLINNLDDLKSKIEFCDQALSKLFDDKCQDAEIQNEVRCNQQEISAKNYRNRRVSELEERISRFQSLGKTNMIPATKGLLRKEKDQFEIKLKQISKKRKFDSSLDQLAVGFVRIT